MRILITGCIAKQVGLNEGEDNLCFAVMSAMTDCLEELGHEYDIRPVRPGEELAGKYDMAIVGVHAFGGIGAQTHKWGALWAASQLPHLPMLEDWRALLFFQHLRKEYDFWWVGNLDYKTAAYRNFELACRYSTAIEETRLAWRSKLRRLLLPAMPWCDLSTLHAMHQVERVYTWCVDSFYWGDFAKPEHASNRLRKWSLVSLQPQEAWRDSLGLTWPVTGIFRPRSESVRGGGMKRGASRSDWGYIPERQLQREVYATHWGMLLPPYGKKTIRGMWRNRWYLSAVSGCAIHTAESDCPPGYADLFSLPVARVEQMGQDELHNLAEEQADFTMSRIPKPAMSRAHLQEALLDPQPPGGRP